MSLAPILLFVYNRPYHTERTLNSLIDNVLAKRSDLYIFSDYAKNLKAVAGVNRVREIITNCKGFNSVTIIKRSVNLGLEKSIIEGVNEIIKISKKIIVLEDDIETSPFFLNFMNDALNLYEFEEDVASISGYLFPIKVKPKYNFFLRGAECWGWATWERSWKNLEENGNLLLEQIKIKRCKREFNFNYSFNYYKMLKKQTLKKNNSWAIRWYASNFLADKLALYPYSSFTRNIGMDNSGTHSKFSMAFHVELCDSYLGLEKIEVKENFEMRKEFERYFWKLSFLTVVNKILRIFREVH